MTLKKYPEKIRSHARWLQDSSGQWWNWTSSSEGTRIWRGTVWQTDTLTVGAAHSFERWYHLPNCRVSQHNKSSQPQISHVSAWVAKQLSVSYDWPTLTLVTANTRRTDGLVWIAWREVLTLPLCEGPTVRVISQWL